MKLLRQELKARPNIKGIFFECAHIAPLKHR